MTNVTPIPFGRRNRAENLDTIVDLHHLRRELRFGARVVFFDERMFVKRPNGALLFVDVARPYPWTGPARASV
jgi:hypothetical protein